jgi:ferritin-like metal-binding protein YciE
MHLNEVHAFEAQALELLEKSRDGAAEPALAAAYDELLERARDHANLVEQKLELLGTGPSILKDCAMALGGLNWASFFQVQRDSSAKLAGFVYAVLHLQVGAYELLARTADRLKNAAIQELCRQILSEKRELADRFEKAFDIAARSSVS